VIARFEILPGLPATGPLPEQFSTSGRGTHREGFVVRINPQAGSSWVGNFQGGIGGFRNVFDHPNRRDLIVVADGQGYVVDPESRALVAHFGGDISDLIEVPEIDALVVTNGIWLEAYGASGSLWRTRRLSWDGVRLLDRNGLKLQGEAYSPLDDCWHPFSVELSSGKCEGGSYNGPPM
jgi:hypothetical protein